MSLILDGAFTEWRRRPIAPSCALSMCTLGCRARVLRWEDHPHDQKLCEYELGLLLLKPSRCAWPADTCPASSSSALGWLRTHFIVFP